MTEETAPAPRPVSLIAVAAILFLMSLYWMLTVRYYGHHQFAATQNLSPDALPKDLGWRATPEERKAALVELRKAQAAQAVSYAWIDKKTGVIQLPIDRAIELLIEQKGKLGR